MYKPAFYRSGGASIAKCVDHDAAIVRELSMDTRR
jgi:hypothetical protein